LGGFLKRTADVSLRHFPLREPKERRNWDECPLGQGNSQKRVYNLLFGSALDCELARGRV
jgi:hypothetical protein